MEKTPYQQLMCTSGTRGSHKEERMVEDDKQPGHPVAMKND
jgi:hypothetical protein